MIVINKDKHEDLGLKLTSKFDTFEKERRQLEIQWLKNLRQYKSTYDPDVKIPENRSRVYPKDTHTKIVGWVAKMMEMMFPAQDTNFSIDITPFPNIAQEDLQNIITVLEQQKQMEAQAQYQEALQQDPQAQPLQVEPLTSDQIEKSIKEFAKQRALRMEVECKDQLSDKGVDYPELCKKTIRRAGIYGFGVVEGPHVKTNTERVFEMDPNTGTYVAVTKKRRKPFYESVKAWDIYPDLSAKAWGTQEGLFTRKVFHRNGLRKLAEREEFFSAVILEYLKDHATGNYKPRTYEAELNAIKHVDQSPPADSRLYEVMRWYGFISALTLQDLGVTVPESALSKDILADVWLLDGQVIKADTAPFGESIADMYHVFIPEDDEDSALTGTAKVEILRDSQLKLCAIDRATMDNMAATAGAVVEVNDDLISPNQDVKSITGGVTIHRNGEGQEANYPAVRVYNIDSHIDELLSLRQSVLSVFDVESNLPSWRMGDAKPLGEAFRTSNNMSMMAGGGDMVTKDDARAFDRFVKSLIGSLVMWNMEFNDKDEIKGDFEVMPKGTISLVAKEVRGAALDQVVATLTPRQQVLIDERGLLEDRFKARDLPLDRIKGVDEANEALSLFDQQQTLANQIQQSLDQSKATLQQANAEKASASAQEIAKLVDVKVQEALSRIAQNMAKVKGAEDGAALQSIKLLLDANKPERPSAGSGKKVERKTAKQQRS